MVPASTRMHQEVSEIPRAVERLLRDGGQDIQISAANAREANPSFLLSVARGSSDHVCTYLKYASELLLGLPMASVGPSVKSVYGCELSCRSAVSVSVSQSGQSPDIVAMTQSLTDAGAFSVAITNNDASPLASAALSTLPIHAGPELSVAATKTFVTSLVTGLWFLAELKQDAGLLRAIHRLPDHLDAATECDWSCASNAIGARSVFTLGRGPSWAISNEAALKFKETCLIHAESYSSAEVLHGPVSIVDKGFPILAFAANDASEGSLCEVADALAEKGAQMFVTSHRQSRANVLPHVRTDHWITDPIANIVSFYGMVEKLAVNRGIDPDTPRHLNKVTETI